MHFGQSRLGQACKLAMRNPREFGDRLMGSVGNAMDARFRRRGSYTPLTAQDVVQQLRSAGFELSVGDHAKEYENLRNDAGSQISSLKLRPFANISIADTFVGEFLYAACRAMRPRVVVETGVAYGLSSYYILAALAANGSGRLISIDLPPLREGARDAVGAIVPSELRDRWALILGPSRRYLPQILREEGRIDLFYHDSLHTYRNIRWELETAADKMSQGGLLLADDVDFNDGFGDAMKSLGPRFSATVQQPMKGRLLGVGLV